MSEKSAANTPRQLPCYAISPFSDVKIPIYLNTNNGYFGTLNANGVPYVDAKLGKAICMFRKASTNGVVNS